MRLGYDLGDGEFAAAIAASAFAIHSIEERKSRDGSEIPVSRTRTWKDDRSLTIESAAVGRPSGQTNRTLSFANDQMRKGNSQKHRNAETKVDAWERSEMEKIRKRYEKMQYDILAWENEKKMRAKLQMENKKKDLELRKERNLQHYKTKVAKIDHTAGGARTQMEEKRKYEEKAVKEKARKIRSRGKVPVTCFCF
ncbi:OLC1v1012328C1 [Oldenlandia corymbosa var. corymbosa]|uniref:OLC1v1012328C1 n=1 Tax=Oldenlandia corymbosa var. corymbosa TaxID=529605 RepID=A0AAV1DVT3_OLDCO|nr:OLC1v1012328C1 [Oldenlandia corymbosa var. corymbosa]